MFSSRTRKELALMAIAAMLPTLILSSVAVGSAAAATVPYHEYSIGCPKLGYWGNRITACPTWIDVQPGVGLSVIDGTGNNYATTSQYVYFAVWGYSYKYAKWYGSAVKRVLNGTPNPVQAYDTSVGAWKRADQGFANQDLAVGPDQVALSPNSGTGTWKIAVETYWAPPFTTWANWMQITYAPPAGGLDTLDYASTTCTF